MASRARDLANLAKGNLTIDASGDLDVSGTVVADGLNMAHTAPIINITDTDTGVDHQINASSGVGNISIKTDVNGEASNGDFFVNTKSDNRLRVQGNGDISFYDNTGVSQGFYWDASGQNLGIGTTTPNPNAKLHVSGGRSYFASNSNAFATYLRYNDTTAGVFVGSSAANEFRVSASSGALRLNIDAEGRLTSSGTGSGDIGIFKTTANSGTGLYINSQTANQIDLVGYDGSAANAVNIRAGGATGSGLIVDTSNNVGIGTESPSQKLTISGTANNQNSEIKITAAGVASGYLGSNSNGLNIGTDSHGIVFKTGVTGGGSVGATGSERMRIDGSTGNVGIGGIPSAQHKLNVYGNLEIANDNVDGYIWFHDPNTRSWSLGSDQSTGNFVITNVQGIGSGQQLSLDSSGNLVATGNVTAYSDERLKSDITTIDSALDKVQAMRGVTFTKDGEAGSGVIAQELEKIAPELVMDGEEYKSVAYGNLVGYLIEAVKELSAKVEELENASSK